MDRGSWTARWLLATALAASVLVCCCQGGLLGRLIGHLAAPALAAAHEDGGCCSQGGPVERPAPSDDRQPCDCHSRDAARSLPDAGPSLGDLASGGTLVLLPTWSEPVASPALRVDAAGIPARARPPTSLLRMHCALLI